MATDMVFDQGDNGDQIAIDANVVGAKAFDFELDSPQRRGAGAAGRRRALVHDHRDGLTINYEGDYPAGVSVVAATINLRPTEQVGGEPRLPAHGQVGDLLLLHNTNEIGGQVVFESLTLWLCVGSDGAGGAGGALHPGAKSWKQIQLGDSIRGTEHG